MENSSSHGHNSIQNAVTKDWKKDMSESNMGYARKHSELHRMDRDFLRTQKVSPVLLEISTIYEKIKKGLDNQIYRLSRFGVPPSPQYQNKPQQETGDAETVPLIPSFPDKIQENKPNRFLDFNRYIGIPIQKYLFFSDTTDLIQSDTLEGLVYRNDGATMDYTELLKTEHYWLNITDPNEADLSMLFNSFKVYDFTIADIRETNTEEKIEFYQHYSFMSTRLLREVKIQQDDQGVAEYFPEFDRHSHSQTPLETPRGRKTRRTSSAAGKTKMTVDMDFNILLFKNFVITMHDKKWTSINDMLGFLNLVCTETPLTPDWVLYSIFIELAQDAQYLLARIDPKLNEHRLAKTSSINDMSRVLRENYEMELQLYAIERFLKPKINILRTLKVKSGRRFGRLLLRYFHEIREDLLEMNNELRNLNHMLERSQDTFIALVSVEKSREANEMSQVMKRISQIALIFLPVQAISGFFGMNVVVPWQRETSVLYFWILVIIAGVVGAAMYFSRSFLLRGITGGKSDPTKKMYNCCRSQQKRHPPI